MFSEAYGHDVAERLTRVDSVLEFLKSLIVLLIGEWFCAGWAELGEFFVGGLSEFSNCFDYRISVGISQFDVGRCKFLDVGFECCVDFMEFVDVVDLLDALGVVVETGDEFIDFGLRSGA